MGACQEVVMSFKVAFLENQQVPQPGFLFNYRLHALDGSILTGLILFLRFVIESVVDTLALASSNMPLGYELLRKPEKQFI